MPSIKEAGCLDMVPSDNDDSENTNGNVNGTTTAKLKSPSSNKSSGKEENCCNPDENFEEIFCEEAIISCTFSSLIERMRDFQYDYNLDKVSFSLN